MKRTMRRLICMATVGAAAVFGDGSARGERVTVTRLDGAVHRGELGALSTREIVLTGADGREVFPLGDVAEIGFEERVPRRSRSGHVEFLLADGGKLSGSLEDGDDTRIVARTALGAGLILPYAHLRGIRLRGPDDAAALFNEALATRLAGKDVLIALGDEGPTVLRGTLTALNPEDGEFRFAGRARRFRTSKIHGVVFAAGAGASSTGRVTVTLIDGDTFTGNQPVIRGDVLIIAATFGSDLEIPLDRVRRLQLTSARVVYLSDWVPQAHESRGILYDDWLIRSDRNVFNQPIALGGRTYDHGLGVHARASLTYALGGKYETFAATVGIDDAVRPGGHVRFVVIGDGKTLLTTTPLTGRDAPQPVRVSVTGVDELTLVVETAGDGDVGDWGDWADARVILPSVQP